MKLRLRRVLRVQGIAEIEQRFEEIVTDQKRTKRLSSIEEAAKILRAGGTVAFPTETVFGLGADARDDAAVQRIFEAKGRPSDNPLIVHLPSAENWNWAAAELTDCGRALLDAFSPGPLTVVLPKASAISPLATCNLSTVAIRIPSCPTARELLAEAAIPIAAPSANRSGRPSCTRWESILEDLDGRIDAVLCAAPTEIGIESTVVDCCGAEPLLLRQGKVTLGQIQKLFPAARMSNQKGQLGEDAPAPQNPVNSPGLRHPHYQPDAQVQLFEQCEELASVDKTHAAVALFQQNTESDGWLLAQKFESIESYEAGFYEFLRECDRKGAKTIFVELAEANGEGAALRDRQERSAGLYD